MAPMRPERHARRLLYAAIPLCLSACTLGEQGAEMPPADDAAVPDGMLRPDLAPGVDAADAGDDPPLDAAPGDAGPEADAGCTPAAESCDGRDEDCDGLVDEGVESGPCMTGLDGLCGAGALLCVDGAEVCVPSAEPGARPELCDSAADEDCDGVVDEAACAVACDDDPSCPQPGLCEGGACVPGDCRLDGECPDGSLCIDRFCAEGDCRDDSDCGAREVCDANACRLIPADCRAMNGVGFGAWPGRLMNVGSGFEASCGAGGRGPDRGFRLDLGDYAGPVCLRTIGSDFDTVLHVRARCGAGDSEIACDDDGGFFLDSRLTVEATPDEQLYVIVDGFLIDLPQGSGAYLLRVSEGRCPCLDDDECGRGEACRQGACVAPQCGDGRVEGPEECDPGAGEIPACDPPCVIRSGYTCEESEGACDAVAGAHAGFAAEPGEALPALDFGEGGEARSESCGEAAGLVTGLRIFPGDDRGDEPRGLVGDCARLYLDGDAVVARPLGDVGYPAIGEHGAPFELACPIDHAMVGYVTRPAVGLSVLCSPLDRVDGRTVIGPAVESEPAPVFDGADGRFVCPEGSAVGGAEILFERRSDDAGSFRRVWRFTPHCVALIDVCRGATASCELIGECAVDAHCPPELRCAAFACVPDEVCDDGVGNNGNGRVDCLDVELCAEHPACAIEAPCGADADCAGGRCLEGQCAAQPDEVLSVRGRPGLRVRAHGELDPADPTWRRPDGCWHGFGDDHAYETRIVANDGPTTVRLTVTADWSGFDGYLHVFELPFDADAAPDGCLGSNGDAEEGQARSRIGEFDLAPGERRALVMSSHWPERYGPYTLDVLTDVPPEACGNGLDDDDDGRLDCDDFDCRADPGCDP